MFIAFSAECKLSASFLECTQCQMLSDLAVFTSNRECAKHCVWCGPPHPGTAPLLLVAPPQTFSPGSGLYPHRLHIEHRGAPTHQLRRFYRIPRRGRHLADSHTEVPLRKDDTHNSRRNDLILALGKSRAYSMIESSWFFLKAYVTHAPRTHVLP